MPVVAIPLAYRGPTQGEAEVRVEGATVRQCLDAVESRHPGFAPLIYDARGEPYSFLKLFVNDEQVAPDELDREVKSDDQLMIVAAVGGG